MPIETRAVSTCPECVEYGEFEIDTFAGAIRTLGRFEAEAPYVVHFDHVFGNGFMTDCECGDLYTEIETEDGALFPELADHVGDVLHFGISDQGFRYVTVMTRGEFDAHETEALDEIDDLESEDY